MKVTTVRIPESLYEDLKDEAQERDLSVSEYIRDVLRARGYTEGHTLGSTDLTERVEDLEATVNNRLDELTERVADVEKDVGEIPARLDAVERSVQEEDDRSEAYDPTDEF